MLHFLYANFVKGREFAAFSFSPCTYSQGGISLFLSDNKLKYDSLSYVQRFCCDLGKKDVHVVTYQFPKINRRREEYYGKLC